VAGNKKMSEQESGWFLKHRDGIEHGPFFMPDLVSAAQSGNIATDTTLRHARHTRDQWVLATRVAVIAQLLSPAAPVQPAPNPATPTPTPPQPKKTIFRPDAARVTPATGTGTSQSTVAQRATAAPVENERDTGSHQQTPRIRAVREDALIVPRTFPDAFCALFDFRFRFFITPWIIKFLWAIAFAVALLFVIQLGYDSLISPNLNATNNTEQSGQNWQFEPLDGMPLLSVPAVRYLMIAMAVFCGLLMFRVICESCIVRFQVAANISELKSVMKEKSD
tara:strand:+ start:865 stop:1701 length:837 start_codon:yes stop_codon:yes gene_type:complete